ncbi:MAG: hypothetical protein A2020_03345 [Lentisphaerae bacterium GWF2_45_14]|nr:MAG: hypothetical protein A2020_03345 [Lentisphaerae bacterium GWF2_45_14]
MSLKIFTAVLLFLAFAGRADNIAGVAFAAKAPVMDGNASDAAWKNLAWRTFENLEFKTCSDGIKIFFLVRFKTPAPLDEHRRWNWDKKSGIYVPGNELETTLNLVIAPHAKTSLFADLWVWRAGRTNPMASADDLYISYDSEKSVPQVFPDKGQSAWYSRYFSDYAGDIIKRFYLRTPSGSAADVSAKGSWKDSEWTIEFSRKLDTGNIDDLRITASEPFLCSFVVGPELPAKPSFITLQVEKGPEK